MLSRRSQIEKATYCMIPFIGNGSWESNEEAPLGKKFTSLSSSVGGDRGTDSRDPLRQKIDRVSVIIHRTLGRKVSRTWFLA